MIYLIRHGATMWSEAGKHTGQKFDLPLTEEGKEEASRVQEALKGINFEKVYTSPLKRAMATCEIAGLLEYAEVDPDLLEWDYGDYEGLTTPAIHRKNPKWCLFEQGAPNGESPAQIAKRADHFWQTVGKVEKPIAVFSSGHISQALIARWLGLPIECGKVFFLATGSLTQLGYQHEIKVLISPSL
jgi:broad specificity phosphatase PhoE